MLFSVEVVELYSKFRVLQDCSSLIAIFCCHLVAKTILEQKEKYKKNLDWLFQLTQMILQASSDDRDKNWKNATVPMAGKRMDTSREEKQTGAAFLDPTLIQMMNRDAGQISKITQLCAPKAKKCHQQEEKMVMMGDPFLSWGKAHPLDILQERQCCCSETCIEACVGSETLQRVLAPAHLPVVGVCRGDLSSSQWLLRSGRMSCLITTLKWDLSFSWCLDKLMVPTNLGFTCGFAWRLLFPWSLIGAQWHWERWIPSLGLKNGSIYAHLYKDDKGKWQKDQSSLLRERNL